MMLQQLISAVEAGTFMPDGQARYPNDFPDTMEQEQAQDVTYAYLGSLDAAKRLHDALLPGWEWHLGPSNAKIYPYNGSPLKSWSGMADNPARAFLLAILRAMEGRDG